MMSTTPLAEPTTDRALAPRRRRAPVRWPWLLVAAAWALALLAALTHTQYLLDHHALLHASLHGSLLPWPLALGLFLAGWQVMTVGMMLPSSMPMVYMMTYAARKQPRPRLALAVFLAGYAAVWTAFALAAFLGDTLIHQAVSTSAWLAEHAYLIGATTLALAGAYQFSPLKERCLTACRSPFGFFVRYYRASVEGAWRLGLRHGLFCLGCCWTLMLVMFGVGVGGLGWMAALTGVMVIEKAVPGGRRIGPLVGFALLALAALWFIEPALFLPSGGA